MIQSLIAQPVKYINCNALSMLKALNKCFYVLLYTTLKADLNFKIDIFLTVNNSTFVFERIQSCAQMLRVGYLALVTSRVWLISY